MWLFKRVINWISFSSLSRYFKMIVIGGVVGGLLYFGFRYDYLTRKVKSLEVDLKEKKVYIQTLEQTLENYKKKILDYKTHVENISKLYEKRIEECNTEKEKIRKTIKNWEEKNKMLLEELNYCKSGKVKNLETVKEDKDLNIAIKQIEDN